MTHRAKGDPAARVPASGLIKLSDLQQVLKRSYFDEEGRKLASSREAPMIDFPRVPAGVWMIDDELRGLHGREVNELVEFEPLELEPQEFDWGPLLDSPRPERVMLPGRYADAERYAEWMREGLVSPPIHVVETDQDTLRVIDGHRRLAAAHLADLPILAWVSWLVPHPDVATDSLGRPMTVALTYELAHGHPWQEK